MWRLFTVGHGARASDELVGLLCSSGVERLVDVRRHPGSRRHPQFGKAALEASMPPAGIAYEWRGEELGGRRPLVAPSRHAAWEVDAFRAYADFMETPAFQVALGRLIEDAAGGPPLAIMCAETLWWQCHRRLIADALTARGVEVVHLVGLRSTSVHVLNPAARVDEHGLLVYDVGVTRSLPLEASEGSRSR